MKMIYFYFIIYPICYCSKFNMNICIIFTKLFLFYFCFKETMEYEKPSIHSTMYQFNTYKIKLLAPPKTQAGGKETE